MPAYTTVQKTAIAQFVNFTSVKDSAAAKSLKANNWNLEQALNAFFQGSPAPTPTVAASSLNVLFDKYRDSQDVDVIGVDGTMRYLGDLGVKLDDVVVLAILTELSAPTMGELTRDGFVGGWKKIHGDTIPRQQSVIAGFRQKLISTPDFFKKVYKYTFKLALTPGQRSLPLDTAIDYWRLLLSPPSSAWSSPQIPWLDWWITYLEERWRKGVNKDMWEQTAVFMTKSLEDPTMSWWSEDGAWPGVLDDFVMFVKERREGTSMDIE